MTNKQPQLKPEEIKSVLSDPEFLQQLGSDPELARLMSEPDKSEAAEKHETLLVLGDSCFISGTRFPLPTLGVWALLRVTDNPFAHDGTPEALDLIKALYIIERRELAVEPLLPLLHAERFAADAPALSESLVAKVAKARAEFDRAALAWFDDRAANIDFVEAVADLELYLRAGFSGFDLMPHIERDEEDKPKKKGLFSIFSTRRGSHSRRPESPRYCRLRPRSRSSGGLA